VDGTLPRVFRGIPFCQKRPWKGNNKPQMAESAGSLPYDRLSGNLYFDGTTMLSATISRPRVQHAHFGISKQQNRQISLTASLYQT
jgi:hypothetical protein